MSGSGGRLVTLLVAAAALPLTAAVSVPSSGASEQPAPRDGVLRSSSTWSDPATLGHGVQPGLAVDPAGDTVVVWAKPERGSDAIRARYRPAGGDWQPAVTIGRGSYPQVGMDREGNATAVWITTRRGYANGIRAARRPFGSGWQQPVQVRRTRPVHCRSGVACGAFRHHLAVSQGGAVVVTWSWRPHANRWPAVVQAAYRPPGGPWGRPQRIADATATLNQGVAIDAKGNAWALYLWLQPATGDNHRHDKSIVRPYRAGRGWGNQQVVRRTACCGTDQLMESYGKDGFIAMDDHGHAAALLGPAKIGGRYRAVVHEPGRPWSDPRAVTSSNYGSFARMVMDGTGAAIVGYAGRAGTVIREHTAGAWSAREAVPGASGRPWLATDHRGDLLVTTATEPGTRARSQLQSYRPANGAWTAPVTVRTGRLAVDTSSEDYGEYHQFTSYLSAVYRDGNAIAVWARARGGVQASLMTTAP